MAFDYEAAKRAGYTDEEINAYLQGQTAPAAPAPTGSFDRAAAKQAGYTDEEINAYLQGQTAPAGSFDRAAAKQAGYTDEEIDAYLNQPADASISFAPQLASMAARVLGPAIPGIPGAVGKVASTAMEIPKDWAKIASILYKNATLEHVGQAIREPWRTATNAVGSYVEGHPLLSKATQTSPAQAVNTVVQGAKTLAPRVGQALVAGAVAPESLFALPYQMAAYEQEKIRANPNAPGLERNPYAMTIRGEAPTVGAAGAMNQRRAIASLPITGVTEQERRILEEDQRRKLDLLTRQEAARRVLGPIAPGQ